MFAVPEPTFDAALQQQAQFATSRGRAYGAIAAQSIEESVTGFAFRWLGRRMDGTEPQDYLSVEEANTRFGIDGHLGFATPVSEYVAAERHAIKQRELARMDILSRSSATGGELLTVALAASLLDPLGDALALVPYAGAAKYAQVARAGHRAMTIGQRIRRGAVEGAAAGMVIEGVLFPLAQNEGRNYTLNDSAFNIALSAGIGSAGRVVGGFLEARAAARGETIETPDIEMLPETDPLISAASPEERAAIFRDAVHAVATGEPVRAGEMLELSATRRAADPNAGAAPEAAPEAAPVQAVEPAGAPAQRADPAEGTLLATLADADLGIDLPDFDPPEYAGVIEARDTAAEAVAQDLRARQRPLDGSGREARDIDDSTPPSTDRPPVEELQASISDLDAELDSLVENGQATPEELEGVDTEELGIGPLPDEQQLRAKIAANDDLISAAGFCLLAEGVIS